MLFQGCGLPSRFAIVPHPDDTAAASKARTLTSLVVNTVGTLPARNELRTQFGATYYRRHSKLD
jgi:hypothetical protein